jgi:hypothetical protein
MYPLVTDTGEAGMDADLRVDRHNLLLWGRWSDRGVRSAQNSAAAAPITSGAPISNRR